MSEYIADVVCPECSGMVWVLQRWRTRTVVSCAACHHEHGVLAPLHPGSPD